jgi:hypothetical protein
MHSAINQTKDIVPSKVVGADNSWVAAAYLLSRMQARARATAVPSYQRIGPVRSRDGQQQAAAASDWSVSAPVVPQHWPAPPLSSRKVGLSASTV